MAFSFQNSGAGGAQAHTAPDLPDVMTEGLGFQALAGETKLRLLPTPWPAEALPPSTSSLLSVASKRGLLAAAGPDSLVVATTDAIREGFTADVQKQNKVKDFTPQAVIPVPRVSQLAFTSDDNYLVIAAEQGGGLAVYDVQQILNGSKDSAFQLGTNQIAVRALVPNPAPELAQFIAVVLSDGKLMIVNLQERQFINGANGGPILKEGVSCASWSAKGKQLVAGLGDGTGFQMTPDGTGKANIPRPPAVPDGYFVAAIYWLANEEFVVVHTPQSQSQDSDPPLFHLVFREKGTQNYSYHKLSDPAPPFGMARFPAHYFISRLRAFPPNLDDLLIWACSASEDVGMFSRSSTPLTNEVDASTITHVYTMTTPANDSRRAQLPMPINDDMGSTSPIGMAMDLSSKMKVPRPIPAEEMDESQTPLPELLILNNEGILSAWWVVYNESIRQGTAYPGLTVVGGGATPAPAAQPSPAPQATPTFGSVGAGASAASPFASAGAASTPAFGKPSAPAFGSPSVPGGSTPAPAFGGASTLGGRPSPWASAGGAQAGGSAFGKPAFGAPSFGQPSAPGAGAAPSFGAPAGLGGKTSVWGAPSNATPTAPKASPFASMGQSQNSPFASIAKENAAPAASPFSSLGQSATSGFASLGQQKPAGGSIFGGGQKPPGITPEPSFGSTISLGSTTNGASSSFGQPSTVTSKWASAAPSTTTTPALGGSSIFGQPSQQQESKDEAMDEEPAEAPAEAPKQEPEKPADKPSGLFGLPSGGFKLGSTFKADPSQKEEPAPKEEKASSFFGSGFGNMLGEAAKEKPQDAPEAPEPKLEPKEEKPAEPVTPIKQEPGADTPNLQEIPSTTPASPPKQAAPAKGGFVDSGKPAAPYFPPSKPNLPRPDSAASASADEEIVSREAGRLQREQGSPQAARAQPDQESSHAGSPPVDLAEELSSSQLSSPGEDEEGSEEGEEDDEGEEEEDGEAEEPEEPTPAKPAGAPSWSFSNASPAQLPKSPQPPTSTTPSFQSPAVSHTPFGLPKGGPTFFPPPTKTQESPRSPSPVRRSISTSAAMRSNDTPAKTLAVPPSKPLSRPVSRASTNRPPQEEEEDYGELIDEDDLRIQEELKRDVEPTRTLAPFLAHQDYAGSVQKPGIPGQIEKVYRDINSMIDTLGLNSRSVQAFIKGHNEATGDRQREDLEKPDTWVLEEIKDLSVVEKQLLDTLEEGRLEDVNGILTRIRAHQADLKKQIQRFHALKSRNSFHPKDLEKQINAPLSAEQEESLSSLRRDYASFQATLVEAEEALTMLKAKIASASAELNGGDIKKVPTVENVTRTIEKMTGWALELSGTVDILEAQIRMQGLDIKGKVTDGYPATPERGSPARRTMARSTGVSTPLRQSTSSLRHSDFLASTRKSPGPGTYGLFYNTPDRPGSIQALAGSVRSIRSMASVHPEPRKMEDLTDEEIRAALEADERRKAQGKMLAEAAKKRGWKKTVVGK